MAIRHHASSSGGRAPGRRRDVAARLGERRAWRRSGWLGPHLGRALVGGVAGYLLGHWLGNLIASGYTNVQGNGQNDVATVLGLSLGVVGWLTGIGGMLNYPLAKMVGPRAASRPTESKSWVALLPVHRTTTRWSACSTRSGCSSSSSPAGCWRWPSAPSC